MWPCWSAYYCTCVACLVYVLCQPVVASSHPYIGYRIFLWRFQHCKCHSNTFCTLWLLWYCMQLCVLLLYLLQKGFVFFYLLYLQLCNQNVCSMLHSLVCQLYFFHLRMCKLSSQCRLASNLSYLLQHWVVVMVLSRESNSQQKSQHQTGYSTPFQESLCPPPSQLALGWCPSLPSVLTELLSQLKIYVLHENPAISSFRKIKTEVF